MNFNHSFSIYFKTKKPVLPKAKLVFKEHYFNALIIKINAIETVAKATTPFTNLAVSP